MGDSVIFALGFFLGVLGFYFQKKSEKPLQGVTWLAMSLLMVLCFHALAAPLFMVCRIPCSSLSFGILDGCLGAVLLFVSKKKKGRQEYRWDWEDLAVIAGIGVLVVCIGLKRYGFPARFVYLSTDAITHYHEAFSVFRTGRVEAMYFSALNDSFLVSFFSRFYRETDLYRAEIYIDLCWLFLTGISFYGFTKRETGKLERFTGIVFVFLYLMGYPLNHMLVGFLYQGMGVVLVSAIWKTMEEYLAGNLGEKTAMCCLLLGCGGLICCYALFVPPVFFALFFLLTKKAWEERGTKLSPWGRIRYLGKWAAENLFVFFYPCVIGIVYTFQGIFKDGVTLEGAIQLEGVIYRNNFTDFVPLLPVAFLGIWRCFKKREGNALLMFFFLEGGYMCLMFYAACKEYVSAYYYYKNNYLIWCLLFLLAVRGLGEIGEKNLWGFYAVFFVAWLLPSLIVLTGVFQRVAASNKNLAKDTQEGYDYCAIYVENWTNLTEWWDKAEHIDLEPLKKELYEKAYELHTGEGARICPVAYGSERYLEEAITNQWYVPYLHMAPKDVGEVVDETQPDYCLVLKDSEEYAKNETLWESLPKIYENEAGFLAVCGKAR